MARAVVFPVVTDLPLTGALPFSIRYLTVVCMQQDALKKAVAAAAVTLPSLTTALPALAVVRRVATRPPRTRKPPAKCLSTRALWAASVSLSILRIGSTAVRGCRGGVRLRPIAQRWVPCRLFDPPPARPSHAQVDARLGGEGTGKIFGISAGPEGWAIFLMFGLVWAVFSTSAKGLGGAKDDDSGLSL